MSSLNKVQLIGNLGADPEIRNLSAGQKVANLKVATNERWKDKNGEVQEKVEWHSVVCYAEPLVDLLAQYAKKGSKIYVEGKMETRKWTDKDGHDRYTTEIILRRYGGEIRLLDRRPQESNNEPYSRESPAPKKYGSNSNSGARSTRNDFPKDDIPF